MNESTLLDRLTMAIRSLIFAEFPTLQFAGLYEYSVTATANGTIDAAPTDPTIGLPSLQSLPLEPSILGESATASVGTLCLVEFVNGSPSRPEVVSLGATVASATIDATGVLSIGPSASSGSLGAAQTPVARETDTCSVYFPPGTTLSIEGTITTPGPMAGAHVSIQELKLVDAATQTVPLPLLGLLGPGSTKAFA